MDIIKSTIIEDTKNIIKTNPFYFTLYLLLRYYFVKDVEFYMLDFIKDVTNTESEFKVFMVYIEFSLYIYNSKKELFDGYEDEDMVYVLVGYVKNAYDADHKVLSPFINSITENETEVINKFNIIKTSYSMRKESLEKFQKLTEAIEYLEKAKEYDLKAKTYTDKALNILTNLKGQIKKTLYNDNLNKLIIKNC